MKDYSQAHIYMYEELLYTRHEYAWHTKICALFMYVCMYVYYIRDTNTHDIQMYKHTLIHT